MTLFQMSGPEFAEFQLLQAQENVRALVARVLWLEKQLQESERRRVELQNRLSDQGWQLSPDRMGS